MAEIFTSAFWAEYGGIILEGVGDTLLMTGLSTLLAYLLGLPMGVVMVLTQPHGIRPNRAVNAVLGWIINIGRSLPFIILMIALFPFTKLVVGTKIGIKGAVVPLVVSAAPFIARMVETSLSEVDAGVIEAAQSMGATVPQIVFKVLLPEAMPSLTLGGSISMVTILAYTAIAGTMLQIKPVLHMDDEGHLINMGKARGRKAALDYLVQKVADTAIDPAEQTMFLSHSDCREDVEYIAEQLKEKCGVKDTRICDIGPVIGSHTGPGCVALFFLGEHR